MVAIRQATTEDEFRKRIEHITQKYPYIVLEEDGSAKRIFPLYGQTTAYWSIEEEMENAP